MDHAVEDVEDDRFTLVGTFGAARVAEGDPAAVAETERLLGELEGAAIALAMTDRGAIVESRIDGLGDTGNPVFDQLTSSLADQAANLSFPFPEQAVRAFGRVAAYGEWRHADDGQVVVPDGVDGVLAGHHPALRRVPRIDPAELDAALRAVGADLAAAGVVAVEDATATNVLADVAALTTRGMPVRVAAMVGADAAAGAPPGTRVKVVVDDDTATGDLAEAISGAHRRGQPVALHVVDVGPLQVALDALAAAPPPPPGRRDRLEHVSLCLPEQVGAVARAGAVVVTQPAFLAHRGDKYRAQLRAVEHAWLYRVGSLLAGGVTVAASSDAPVVPARPLESVQAMVHREPPEAVDVATALDLVTRAAAAASGTGGSGTLGLGHRADFAVLGADPRAVAPSELAAVPVAGTWVGGQRAGEGTVDAPGAVAGTVAVGRCPG